MRLQDLLLEHMTVAHPYQLRTCVLSKSGTAAFDTHTLGKVLPRTTVAVSKLPGRRWYISLIHNLRYDAFVSSMMACAVPLKRSCVFRS